MNLFKNNEFHNNKHLMFSSLKINKKVIKILNIFIGKTFK